MTDSSFNYTNLTLEELRTLAASPQIGAIEAMPPAFRHLATSMGEVADLLTKAQADLPNWWKGQAADQAAAALGRAAAEAHEFHGSAISAATAIARCATIVAEQQHQMMNVPEAPEPGVTAIIDPPKTPMAALEAARQDAAYQAAREQAVQVVNGIAAQYVETREHLANIGGLLGENFEPMIASSGSGLSNTEEVVNSSKQSKTDYFNEEVSYTRDPISEVETQGDARRALAAVGSEEGQVSATGHESAYGHVLPPAMALTESTRFSALSTRIRPPTHSSTQKQEPYVQSSRRQNIHSGQLAALGVEDAEQPPKGEFNNTVRQKVADSHNLTDIGDAREKQAERIPQDLTDVAHLTQSSNLLQENAAEPPARYGYQGSHLPEPTSPETLKSLAVPPGTHALVRRDSATHNFRKAPQGSSDIGYKIAHEVSNHDEPPTTDRLTHQMPDGPDGTPSSPLFPPFGNIGSAPRGRTARNPRPAYLKERQSVWLPDTIAAPADGIITPDWFTQS